jgi:hypothetical protein
VYFGCVIGVVDATGGGVVVSEGLCALPGGGAMNGLDLLLVAGVVAGAFLLFLHGAYRLEEMYDELDCQFCESTRRDSDGPVSIRELVDRAETEREGGEGGDVFAQRRGVTGCGHVAEAAEVETDSGLIAGRTDSSSHPSRSVSAPFDWAESETTA